MTQAVILPGKQKRTFLSPETERTKVPLIFVLVSFFFGWYFLDILSNKRATHPPKRLLNVGSVNGGRSLAVMLTR